MGYEANMCESVCRVVSINMAARGESAGSTQHGGCFKEVVKIKGSHETSQPTTNMGPDH